jgi:Xaa-Pro aminopeptidase
MSERLDRLAERLAERDLDALLVTDLVNVRYLTGFTGTNGAALFSSGERIFYTDFRYLTQAAEQVEGWEHRIAKNDLLAAVVKDLPDEGRLGFDDAQLPVKAYEHLAELAGEGVELAAAGGVVEDLRAVKDPEEIEKIRAAAQLADRALEEVLGRGLAGRTERDVALDLEFTQRRLGAEGASFPAIVAFGEHGALPHASPRDVEIPADTLVVVDWGCMLGGYASDCTRTYATGEVDPRDREVYDLVARAQEEALAAVRPGPTGKEVDAVAREIIDGAGHAEHFGHGLGHGVGMDVHEGPRLTTTSDTALKPGHVVTVEPGVYVPGAVGVRIEDLVVVTEDGHDVLSSLPKDLTTID